MKTYDMELTLRTEVDTYAKQSFTLSAHGVSSFSEALELLRCQLDLMPRELIVINKHTIECIFGERE